MMEYTVYTKRERFRGEKVQSYFWTESLRETKTDGEKSLEAYQFYFHIIGAPAKLY